MSEEIEQHKLLGQALQRLRKKAGLTQVQAGERHGTNSVTWGRYEAGTRRTLMRTDVQDAVSRAIGYSRLDLLQEAENILSGRSLYEDQQGPAVPAIPTIGRAGIGASGFGIYVAEDGDDVDLSSIIDGNSRALRIVTEDLAPFVEPGGFVIYNTRKIPRRHQGVVVRLRDGSLIPRFYIRTMPGQIQVARIVNEIIDGKTAYIEVVETIPAIEAEGVYPIVLRGE